MWSSLLGANAGPEKHMGEMALADTDCFALRTSTKSTLGGMAD